MYNDMATGVAEGTVIFPTAHGGGYKFFEVAPYWTVTGFGAMNQNILTINADTAAKLPADVMKIIEEEALVYGIAVNEDASVNYYKGLAKLVEEGQKRGLSDTVYYLPIEQQAIWAEELKDWPNQRANDILNEYGIDAIKIMDEYMDMMEDEGHVWPVRYEFKKL
jgi:TRAP-type C4-dicarboxylate transport system substrate-binding protein